MQAKIAGLGQWFPERVRRNSEWPEAFSAASRQRQGDRALVDVPNDAHDATLRIVQRYLAEEEGDPFLGARERRVADDSTTSSEAEARAARVALDDAGVKAEDVDAILSWALVPDRLMPSNACRVAEILGARRAWAASLDAACASPIAQLNLAASLIESGRAEHVLLTQSHLATRTFPLLHPAAPSVGDGAAAIVVTAADFAGIQHTHSRTHGEYYDAVVWCRGKTDDSDPPWWQPGGAFSMGSRNAEMTRALMQDTVPTAARTIAELAERARFAVDSIRVLLSVQPRRWVPLAIAEALGLAPTVAVQTYERYAHLGGVGPIVNLIAAREAGLLQPGARVVMYAQGAGFTRAAAALSF
ncbi:MAG TPA: 3-oxoacyl-[acyl-carrier-protein] synthase III C-terminal domain-containing protein [Polyangiaceae bacterium]|jgi:3-oxoacyl-[acyl-carrier-protein] synthase-3|nr:3-oxoacyl-[acyl-carrier-protein] synthase III C-terminal domain-containing protein [Polyangiaceae bacterium]